MIQEFNKVEKVNGTLELPGDKSISHRSVMFASLAKGTSRIYNLSNGEDVKSTKKSFIQLGIDIKDLKDFVEVTGRGFKGFTKPTGPLDMGNSGTTTRLISGILAAQNFSTKLIGDQYLSKRPMKRIVTPLSRMGAKIEATENFTLPLNIYPSEKLAPIDYELPIASAQVKSAVLLAGLHCEGTTSVIEKIPARDHTEKMLGLKTETTDYGKISYVSKDDYPEPKEYLIPADISTAAFFIVLALLTKDSTLRLRDVSLNKTRTGILDVLTNMGAKIEIENKREIAGEMLGDIIIFSGKLNNVEIPESIIPNIIDEIPILAIAGVFAEGAFTIKNASELRGKETDRINAVCSNLRLLGLSVEEFPDGFSVTGSIKNQNILFESYGDHRIAMSFSILSMLLNDGGKVNNFDCVSVSNPDFLSQLKKIIR